MHIVKAQGLEGWKMGERIAAKTEDGKSMDG